MRPFCVLSALPALYPSSSGMCRMLLNVPCYLALASDIHFCSFGISQSSSNFKELTLTVDTLFSIMRSSTARHFPRLPPAGRVCLSSLTKRTSATAFQLRPKCSQSVPAPQCSGDKGLTKSPSIFSSQFWGLRKVWSRAAVNTLRCLVGCTLGDFSSMWYLQAAHPDLGTGTIIAISSIKHFRSSNPDMLADRL